MDTSWQDFRYAVRGLLRNPGFALTAILSIALGIGSSLAIFTVTDSLLLRPLPYPDADRLVMVWEAHRLRPAQDQNVISPGNYFDWKKQNEVFDHIAAFGSGRAVLSEGPRTEELESQYFSADLLPMLGVQPVRGRIFTAADDRPRGDALLISYRVWQTWFNGDENIVGRKVQVDSTPTTIIGVLPPAFYFRNREIDLWQPLGLDPARDYRATAGRYLMCLARLKPGVTRVQAQANMTAVALRLEAANPKFDANWTVNVEPLRDSLVRQVKTSLWILLGAVGLLLAVACANVANLLLARFVSRRGEMAVRVALGAGRGRVMRQLLTESVLLGITGGLFGILAARGAVYGLLRMAPRDLVRGAFVSLDLRVLLVALSLSILTGVFFGLAPALVTSRAGLIDGLRQGGRSGIGGSGRLRAWFVGAEVALSVILLVGASLLFRSLMSLQGVNPGIDAANVLTFRVSLPSVRYREPETRTRFFARALEQLERVPGVRSAGAVSFLDFNGMVAGTDVRIAGHADPKPGEELIANIRTVMPGYFRTLGIPIRGGRDFTAADNEASAPYRFVVNEAFARNFMRGEQPVGSQIKAYMGNANPFGEIIGVAGDVNDGALDKPARPTVYYIHKNLSYSGMVFVVRTSGNPMAIAEAARRVVRGLDSAQPIADVRPMETILADTFARQRFSAFLLSGFSITALLLAAIGIYGVLAYSVGERTREIGVRMALGAQPASIAGLVIASGVRVVIAGTAVGIAGALALSGLLKSLLFGIGPRDAVTFVTVPVVLIGVALLAAYVPARRASRLQPMTALRSD